MIQVDHTNRHMRTLAQRRTPRSGSRAVDLINAGSAVHVRGALFLFHVDPPTFLRICAAAPIPPWRTALSARICVVRVGLDCCRSRATSGVLHYTLIWSLYRMPCTSTASSSLSCTIASLCIIVGSHALLRHQERTTSAYRRRAAASQFGRSYWACYTPTALSAEVHRRTPSRLE